MNVSRDDFDKEMRSASSTRDLPPPSPLQELKQTLLGFLLIALLTTVGFLLPEDDMRTMMAYAPWVLVLVVLDALTPFGLVARTRRRLAARRLLSAPDKDLPAWTLTRSWPPALAYLDALSLTPDQKECALALAESFEGTLSDLADAARLLA